MKKFALSSLFFCREVFPLIEKMEDSPGFGIALENISLPDSQNKIELIGYVEKEKNGFKELIAEYHLSDFRIEVIYRVFPEGDAISLEGKIINEGSNESLSIHSICPFFQSFNLKRSDRVLSLSFSGGRSDFRYPPFAFTPRQSELVSYLSNCFSATYSHGGLKGRSTDDEMPYHILQIDKEGGIYFALEWPGDWVSIIRREEGGEKLTCQIGLANGYSGFDLKLMPKEAIPLPGCLIGFYKGDIIEGCCSLKGKIVKYYIPKLNGKSIVPPVFFDHWFAMGLDCSESVMKKQAEFASEIGCEYFVLDAGWYEGCGEKGENFSEGLGNWTKFHPKKYPNGIRGLAEFVREKGMKFGLWIEPERCHENSEIGKNHSDWIIHKENSPYCLVDFGKKEVVEWAKETFGKIFEENGVEWIRFDSNIDPQFYWQKIEKNGRKGIFQIRHFEGLLNFWDYLLEKFPNLLIEGCSSGGRRMDLACLKRSHTYWCNDHTHHPDIVRTDMRANLIIPGNYLNHVLTILNNEEDYPDYVYHCLMGGTLGFTEKLSEWSRKKIEDAKKHVKIFKKYRHLLMCDFNPLFPYPSTLENWDGGQWYDKEKEEGLIIVFRVLSQESSAKIKLRWIEENKNYEFINPYTDDKKIISGKELINQSFNIELPEERSSIIIIYRAI